jgi:hypothetical protein
MKNLFAAVTLLALCSCTRVDFAPATPTACQTPFVDLKTSQASKDDQQILQEAAEDFCAVVEGKDPIHAKVDTTADLPSDGGTRFFVGRKYRLTALNSLSSFGSYNGVANGPILTFDSSFAMGNTREISNIRVYTGPPAPPLPQSQ